MACLPVMLAVSVAPPSSAAWVQHAKKAALRKTERVQHRYFPVWRGSELCRPPFQVKNENEKAPMASTTKIMTCIVALEYAKENFKLDISNFIITEDNKIDNLKNKQKPKNVIDFLQRELNLSTKEAIGVCVGIYEDKEYVIHNKKTKKSKKSFL